MVSPLGMAPGGWTSLGQWVWVHPTKGRLERSALGLWQHTAPGGQPRGGWECLDDAVLALCGPEQADVGRA